MRVHIEKNNNISSEFFTLVGAFMMGSLVNPSYIPIITPVFVIFSIYTINIELK